ncbi:MAG TPA: discoidin domain-containing protein [Planctomycetaceae bacterium]|nr:discoidin domain-containing protein [Planctomycetaceae bacterium]
MGGPSRTRRHLRFAPKLCQSPHELLIDSGAEYTIRGFCYQARQDESGNGTIPDRAFYVSNDRDTFETPALKATFRKTKEPPKETCEPVRGRYVLPRALSKVNGRPWVSIAELGVIGSE